MYASQEAACHNATVQYLGCVDVLSRDKAGKGVISCTTALVGGFTDSDVKCQHNLKGGICRSAS